MTKIDKKLILSKLDKLGDSFQEVLNIGEPEFIKQLTNLGYSKSEAESIVLFDWFQGVGLYGFFKLFELTQNEKYWKIINEYYEKRIKIGLPPKNVNSTAPMLTLCFLNEKLKNKEYEELILSWSDYIYNDLPRTEEGGFQHTTWESTNANQLWVDTLFMTVLFMAKVGIMYNKDEYVEEAIFQFLLHQKYLVDRKTGFWFHGFSFEKKSNYSESLWGRGNAWIAVFIPEFIEILDGYKIAESSNKMIFNSLINQVISLSKTQNKSGLWHTLLDDETSYLEASSTAGFGFGILKSVRKGYIRKKYQKNGLLALSGILDKIDDDGVLKQVSAGTRMGSTKDFYKEIPLKSEPYGQALAMLFLIEALNFY